MGRERERERECLSIPLNINPILTITELILNDHVIFLGPGRVVANKMRMRAKDCMGTYLSKSSRSEQRGERERESTHFV